MQADNRHLLLNLIPESTYSIVNQWFDEGEFIFHLSKPRRTKLGDFKVIPGRNNPVISINSDLNPHFSFFIFTHEYAHYLVWKNFRKRTKAHGNEWKKMFGQLLFETANHYPSDLKYKIIKHSNKPMAGINGDIELMKAFKILQNDNTFFLLEELGENQRFRLNDRIFVKGIKRRTRYLCYEASSKKKYLISQIAEVEPVNN